MSIFIWRLSIRWWLLKGSDAGSRFIITRLLGIMMTIGVVLCLPQIRPATILAFLCFLETGVHYRFIIPFFIEIVLCLFDSV